MLTTHCLSKIWGKWAPSQHDWKIVYRDVKQQSKQKKNISIIAVV